MKPSFKKIHVTESPNAASPPVQGWLQSAIALHQLGELSEAWTQYEYHLKAHPDHPDGLHLMGVIAYQTRKPEKAISLIERAIKIAPTKAAYHANLALALRDLNKPDLALASYDQAIAINPKFADAFNNRGIVLHDLHRYEDALASYAKAIKYKPNHTQAHNNIGNLLRDLKRYNEALVSYDKAIELDAKYAQAYLNRGNILVDLQRQTDALSSYSDAISIKPDYAEAYASRGNTLRTIRQFDEALVAYDAAIALKPDYVEAINSRGATLHNLNRLDDAIISYQHAIALRPNYAAAHNNLGNTLYSQEKFDAALASYAIAISINSSYAEAFNNRGITLHDMRQLEQALASFDDALKINPLYAAAYLNRGNVLKDLKRMEEAVDSFNKAVAIDPKYDYLFGDMLHTKMKTCDWDNFDDNLSSLTAQIKSFYRVIAPFPLLLLIDSAELHTAATKLFVDSVYPSKNFLHNLEKRPKSEIIKIGYYSADFHNHATAHLMAELFEMHNREKFEIHGFSFGLDRKDSMHNRVASAFHHFHDVRKLSNREVAVLSRDLGIDIAIDLKGYTQHSRTGIFAERCAPIQVNYLGYPGSMAADFIDYIIADKALIPIDHQKYFTERVAYLPNSYQVNDAQRKISNRIFTKKELGLPESGFIYCCFNNNFKMLPATFDGWMRILAAVPDSVLWLFEDNATAANNLRKEAAIRGINSTRLVFAKRLPLAEHLARHRLADLFIDTLPCNAHTTCSDALWAGLPVLTCTGQTFASRVSASLLNAIGLPELITTTQEAYEALAISLGQNTSLLSDLKAKLDRNRLTTPLFDSHQFTGHIEMLFQAMYQRHHDGLPPDHIDLQDNTGNVSQHSPVSTVQLLTELTTFLSCPLCGSVNSSHLITADCSKYPIYKPALSSTMRWLKCEECTHVFRDGFYTEGALKILFDETHTKQQVGHDLERQRIISSKIIEKILPLKTSGVWLDVGFGNGALLFTAQEYGFSPLGLDLRKSNTEAIKKMGIQALCCDITQVKLEKKCSVISMADVLEHIPFPKLALIAAYDLLESGGVLFLSMPNIDSMAWKVMDTQRTNPYWAEMEHCHNFGKARLYELLTECGFTPVRYGISERYRMSMEIIAAKV